MKEISNLPIEQQICVVKEAIKNSENHIKHYSSNPIQLDALRFKIQEQGLQDHNKKLHKQLESLEKELITN